MTRRNALACLLPVLTGCDYLYHQRVSYAIVGATLMDGTAMPPVENSVLLVEEDKITAMGLAGQIAIPKQAVRIDGVGKFIFPMSLSQPLKVGGSADLLVLTINPAREQNYKRFIYGRMDNGHWWSAESSGLHGKSAAEDGARQYIPSESGKAIEATPDTPEAPADKKTKR